MGRHNAGDGGDGGGEAKDPGTLADLFEGNRSGAPEEGKAAGGSKATTPCAFFCSASSMRETEGFGSGSSAARDSSGTCRILVVGVGAQRETKSKRKGALNTYLEELETDEGPRRRRELLPEGGQGDFGQEQSHALQWHEGRNPALANKNHLQKGGEGIKDPQDP